MTLCLWGVNKRSADYRSDAGSSSASCCAKFNMWQSNLFHMSRFWSTLNGNPTHDGIAIPMFVTR